MRGRDAARVAFALLPMLAAAGQDRATTVGAVLGTSGAPLPGAQVRCIGGVPPGWDAFAPPDVVVATSDDRGRFRLELRSDCVYSVHALGPARENGRHLATAVVEGVTAGAVQTLRCIAEVGRVRLAVSGLAAWGEDAPRRARVRIDAVAAEWTEVALDEDGSAVLPPLPAHRVRVVLADAEGQPLWTFAGEPQRGRIETWLPPPLPLTVRVVGEDGAAIAGALVGWQLDGVPAGQHGDWLGLGSRLEIVRRLGACDATGRLVARLPCALESWRAFRGPLPLFASAPGRAEVWAGWLTGSRIVGGRVEDIESGEKGADATDTAAGELRIELPRALPLRGRILDGGVPVADRGVLLACECRLPNGLHGWNGLDRVLRTRTAADGSFAFASVPRSAAILQLDVDVAPGERPLRLAVLDRVPEQPFAIDLASLPSVRLQVLDAAGGPALGARALVSPARAPASGTWTGLPLDRAGRLQVSVQPGRWMVFVTDRHGWALQEVELDDDAADVRLVLEPLATMRGVVRDAQGRPVADVPFSLVSSMSRRASDEPRDLWLHDNAFTVDRGLLRGVRTGADGAFELRFVPVEGLQLGGSLGGRGSFALEAQDGVELRVER